MPEPEDRLLNALARLHAAGRDSIADGSRFVGHVPRARPARAGLGPAGRAPGAEVLEEPAARVRVRPRGGAGRRLRPDRASSGPPAPGWPTGRSPSGDPISPVWVKHTRARALPALQQTCRFLNDPVVVVSPVNSGRVFLCPDPGPCRDPGSSGDSCLTAVSTPTKCMKWHIGGTRRAVRRPTRWLGR